MLELLRCKLSVLAPSKVDTRRELVNDERNLTSIKAEKGGKLLIMSYERSNCGSSRNTE